MVQKNEISDLKIELSALNYLTVVRYWNGDFLLLLLL